jgi:hypothetical protein
MYLVCAGCLHLIRVTEAGGKFSQRVAVSTACCLYLKPYFPLLHMHFNLISQFIILCAVTAIPIPKQDILANNFQLNMIVTRQKSQIVRLREIITWFAEQGRNIGRNRNSLLPFVISRGNQRSSSPIGIGSALRKPTKPPQDGSQGSGGTPGGQPGGQLEGGRGSPPQSKGEPEGGSPPQSKGEPEGGSPPQSENAPDVGPDEAPG